ncbi:MAG TPA: hypothetical protein VF610_00545, partial [Segetibacter sp.]
MKNINFKTSKYVLPLIVLPFIFVFFYVFKSWGANSKTQLTKARQDSVTNKKSDEINAEIPGVSKDVAQGDIKDRFQSLREAYKNDKDYSALSELDRDKQPGSDYSSAYSEEDIDRIKTNDKFNNLNSTLNTNRAKLDRNMEKLLSRANQGASYPPNNHLDKRAEEIFNQLQRQSGVSNSDDRSY